MPLSKSDQARINGAKSRGPKTREGKARSSLNALKHGRYATNAIVLKNEDPEAFEDLVANYAQIIQPANTVEYHLTRELAAINWLLTRIYAMDTRLLDHEMDMQTPALDSAGLTVQELTRLTAAGRSIVDRSQYPNYLARRAAQLVRARQSTLAFLKDLRKNFPLAESATEVVPPQPLNPELPTPIEPATNQTGVSGAALQRRAGSPEPASNPKPVSSDSAAPQVCVEPRGPASNQVTLDSDSAAGAGVAPLIRAEALRGPAPEQTSPQPANILSIDPGVESGEHASNLTSGNLLPGAASNAASLITNSACIPQPAVDPIGSAPVDSSAGQPGGRPLTGESAPLLPKAA
jgi:hypothetical protein